MPEYRGGYSQALERWHKNGSTRRKYLITQNGYTLITSSARQGANKGLQALGAQSRPHADPYRLVRSRPSAAPLNRPRPSVTSFYLRQASDTGTDLGAARKLGQPRQGAIESHSLSFATQPSGRQSNEQSNRLVLLTGRLFHQPGGQSCHDGCFVAGRGSLVLPSAALDEYLYE